MFVLGDFEAGDTIYFPFDTYDSSGGSVTITGLAVTDIEVYKDGSVTQRASDNGYTLLDTDGIDFDSTTGLHGFSIDTSDNSDSGFWAAGSQYWVNVNAITVDGQTVRFTYYLTLGRLLKPTTAGRKLDVTATGAAGIDWGNVENPTTTVGLSGTTVKTATDVETDTADIQSRIPAALTGAGNIKADVLAISDDATAANNLEAMLDGTGAVLTVTQLRVAGANSDGGIYVTNSGGDAVKFLTTNPGSNGLTTTGSADGAGLTGGGHGFLATGGSVVGGSVNAGDGFKAAGGTTSGSGAAGVPVRGNVTGNITGNLSGSVGSVTGAVGSVTGAVGSVTGNVGGNVAGSVGSVTGAINTAAGTIQTLDALDTAQDSQHSTTQGKVDTAQADLDIITGADGVNLLSGTQASIDAIEADTNELQGDWADGGRLDLLLDALPTLLEIFAGGDIDGFTFEEAQKLQLAAMTGKLSGAGTTTIVIRAADDSKDRITAAVDSDGNRSAITLDGDD